MTALPLFWGEGNAGEVLSGQVRRARILDELARDFDVAALDELRAETLGTSVLMLAQPRLLAPVELVALDTWVRDGGRVLIFADPRLDWPSRYPLGDSRRPPPVTLLDPLLARWRLTLEEGEGGTGRWRAGAGCTQPQPEVVDCAIGRGRAILVGDADLLDERGADFARHARWVRNALGELAGRPVKSTGLLALGGGAVALLAALALDRRREQKRKAALNSS